MKIVINGRVIEVSGSGSSASSLPKGIIAIWSGTLDNIPTGWNLCDGTNGTPDLRDKFVLGAGEAHQIGEEGGEEEVTLTVGQMPKHIHNSTFYVQGSGLSMPSQVPIGTISVAGNAIKNMPTTDSGSSQPHPNMPPYYAIAYIMKR